ncbi:DUF721 domain-containing protein [Sporohalobacter salinus]|uniref:DUF721 domain-containing protein n=1 Tax=Sporohalobacter salinus TaxID=1494606 RepID=UPI00196142E7|nr:DUF721 domain-containing protein [Sporohalobacter salinus]MBM7624297.1 putative nucleic acid-binding Zn ribbon protein [Sporohalobacter salinus]
MVKPINRVLEKTLQDLSLSHKIKEQQVLNIWPKVIGDKVKKHTKASYINQGTLFVTVDNSTWAHQLLFLKEDLISRLNQHLDQKMVEDIRFKLGSINSNSTRNHKFEDSFDLSEIELTLEEVNEVEDKLRPVSDEELKQKLYSILVKNKKLNKWKEKEGWVRCDYCSAFHPKEAKNCIICQLKSRKNFSKIENLLIENPWLTYEEIIDFFPSFSYSDYNRIREELLTDFWQDIKERIPQAMKDKNNGRSTQEVRVLIQNYVMLKKRIQPDNLSRNIIKKVIGKNYIQVYDQL